MKVTKSTIARTIVLVIALINQVLTMSGYNPLPWSDTEIYEAATLLLTVISSIVAWWENNSFTPEAIVADSYKNSLKEAKKKELAE